MDRTVAYLTNEHPFYLKMLLNSVGMLRKHNQVLPVKVFLIRDHSTQTIERENISRICCDISDTVEKFKESCHRLGAEVLERPPLIYDGEENFFHINRKYMSELPEKSVLYIDADTFIFGDVGRMMDCYSRTHFAACKAEWAYGRGWKDDLLPLPGGPFSSGLMIWNHGSIVDWCDNLPDYLSHFRENADPLANWLHTLHSDCLLREEFSVSLHVASSGMPYEYIHKNHCHLIRHDQDIADVGKSLIFHSYTPNWKKCYRKLRGEGMKRIACKGIVKSRQT